MLVHVPGLLSAEQVARVREILVQAEWVDGRVTAGPQSARVKENQQVPEGSAAARTAGDIIVGALERNPLFLAAALPLKVFPPLFNRYQVGETFGTHVDGPIRQVPGTPHRVRTDLSATLFLTPPDAYDGGELTIDDTYGLHRVKLAAGDMILYPGSSLHRVEPVTRGARIAAFFWIQSMVREDSQRTLLFDLDTAIQQLGRELPDHGAVVQLTNVYNNLLRRWADA